LDALSSLPPFFIVVTLAWPQCQADMVVPAAYPAPAPAPSRAAEMAATMAVFLIRACMVVSSPFDQNLDLHPGPT
jgi:hypothetical protein